MRIVSRFLLVAICCFPISLFAQASVEGSWTIDFPTETGATMTASLTMANGAYSVDLNSDGTPDVKGNYSISGDEMTIEDTEGSQACEGKGVYKVEVSGNTMKMTRVSDPCTGRGGPEGVMVFTKA